MNGWGLQFFVLDMLDILLVIIVLGLTYMVYWLCRKHQEQKKMFEALEKTIDRVLEIDASGGIDGRRQALEDQRHTKASKSK